MARHTKSRALHHLLLGELQPYPGRLKGALTDTLGVVLAVVLAETLRVPGISLAVALLFLMQRERPGLTMQTGIQIVGGAACACAAAFFWVQLTDGTAEFRFIGVALGIFISAFCMAGSRWPLFWTIFAFYGFVDIAAWDGHHSADSIVTGSLNNVASLALVVLCAVGVAYAFHTSEPEEELDREMHHRLRMLHHFYLALAEGNEENIRTARHRLIQAAQAGDLRLNELYDRLLDSRGIEATPIGLQFRIGLLARVLEQSIIADTHHGEPSIDAYRTLAELCSIDGDGKNVLQQASLHQWPVRLRAIATQLEQYQRNQQTSTHPASSVRQRQPASIPFFHPDAFQSTAAVFYALKLTLAAIICYVLYNAFAWPGILTCVVTVLFTGLSSTGAMKQKQLYRFAGAAIGGLIGIATVSLLFPNMDSITSLVIVVAVVSLLSGWVLRSPNMSYIGVQIAFAFSLTALPGFSAATQIAPARDRLIGISLGIAVMWFVFDQLWPVTTQDELDRILQAIQQASVRLKSFGTGALRTHHRQAEQLRMQVSGELLLLQQLDAAMHFDIGHHHLRRLAKGRNIIRRIDQEATYFYAELLSGQSEEVNMDDSKSSPVIE